jgi:protein-S-isoprenylcysteine O-methyltransferase Ste14
MRVVLWAGALAIPLSFTFAGLLRSAAMTTDAHALPVYVAGVALVLAGGLLRRHCFKMLGSSFTYDVRVSTGQTVVERGAYRFVRHPSYTAGLLLFAGIGLALGNWASLAVSVIPLGFAYGYRISVEERALLAALGPAYADYMRRTYRLIPFVF